MSMRDIAALLLVASLVPAFADEMPNLGEPVDADSIAAIDFTILPDGDGLPAGSGTAAAGESVYIAHCLACHGDAGTGALNDALAGGRGSLATDAAVKTIGSYWPYATTVFDYLRRAMPLPSPGVLTNDELYAVTAYLLYVNDIVGKDDVIDAESLPRVRMPNRDGFVRMHEEN